MEGLGSDQGQKKLFDDSRCFFYITNDWETPAEEIVFDANDRCNQENLVEQLKSGVRSLTAPVDSLLCNWAYMVMAGLAWSLKAWAALLLPETGRWKEQRCAEKRRLLRMDFTTFRQAMIKMPSQISGRAANRVSPVGMESVAAGVLPSAGSIATAATLLTRHP